MESKNAVVELVFYDSDLHCTLLFFDSKDIEKVNEILEANKERVEFCKDRIIIFQHIDYFGKDKNIRVLRRKESNKCKSKVEITLKNLRASMNEYSRSEYSLKLHVTTKDLKIFKGKIKDIRIREILI